MEEGRLPWGDSGQKGLRMPFGGGEAAQLHQQTSGVPPAATKCAGGTSLLCLRVRKTSPSLSVPTVVAKTQRLGAWGHHSPADSPCLYCAGNAPVLSGPGAGQPRRGPRDGQRVGAGGSLAGVNPTAPSSLSRADLVRNTYKQWAALINAFVLSCVVLE